MASDMSDWKITSFAGDDEFCWDTNTGLPTRDHFAGAVQVWSVAQNRPTTIGEAAKAFNVAPALIREAVDGHYWMMVDGDGDDAMICHEGE